MRRLRETCSDRSRGRLRRVVVTHSHSERGVPTTVRDSLSPRATVDAIERQQDWEPTCGPAAVPYGQPHPPLKLFIRQPLNPVGDGEQKIVEGVLQILYEMARTGVRIEYLTGHDPAVPTRPSGQLHKPRGGRSTRDFRRYVGVSAAAPDAFLYFRTAIARAARSRSPTLSLRATARQCFSQCGSRPRSRRRLLADSKKCACDLSRVRDSEGSWRGDLHHYLSAASPKRDFSRQSHREHQIWHGPRVYERESAAKSI